MWTGPGVTSPLQHNSHQSWILPGWSYLHPQQSTRHVVGPSQSGVGINEGPGVGRPKPPRVPSPRGETTQVPMSWDVGPLPPRLARVGGLLTRRGAPGGHWQGRGRAWGACEPLGAGGCSRGCGRGTRQAPFPSPGPALHPRVAVSHTVKVTQDIWSDVRVHRSPWPHPGLASTLGTPLPPLQMHPGQVGTVNAKWKARGPDSVSLAGQGESRGTE